MPPCTLDCWLMLPKSTGLDKVYLKCMCSLCLVKKCKRRFYSIIDVPMYSTFILVDSIILQNISDAHSMETGQINPCYY